MEVCSLREDWNLKSKQSKRSLDKGTGRSLYAENIDR